MCLSTFPVGASPTLLDEIRTLANVPGLSVATVEGRHIQAETSGRTMAIAGPSVDNATVFHAASLGKVVTAYLALLMVSRGELSLDQPLVEVLGGDGWATPADRARAITARHVLTHTSGLSNRVSPVDPVVIFEPGTRFSYSGNGFYFLQLAIEAVRKQPIEQVMRDEVFGPLGMTASSYDPTAELGREAVPHAPLSFIAAGIVLITGAMYLTLSLLVIVGNRAIRGTWRPSLRARRICFAVALMAAPAAATVMLGVRFGWVVFLYLAAIVLIIWTIWSISRRMFSGQGSARERRFTTYGFLLLLLSVLAYALKSQMVPFPPMVPDPKIANTAYSFRTTPADLARFAIALMDIGELGPDMRDLVFVPHIAVSEAVSWSVGLGVEDTPMGQLFWQTGQNPGFESIIVLDPDSRRAIVAMTNGTGGREAARQVALSFFNTQADLRSP